MLKDWTRAAGIKAAQFGLQDGGSMKALEEGRDVKGLDKGGWNQGRLIEEAA